MTTSVLVTGGAGRIGRVLTDALADRYDFRVLDRDPIAPERLPAGIDPAAVFVGDITDRALVDEAIDGCAAVIHLAGDPRPEAGWPSVLENNIDGTYTVYRAAVDAGCERIVFASSNHAVRGYETAERLPQLYEADDGFRLDGTERLRPGNLYGVSKATGELLGRWVHDETGIAVMNVRVGNLTLGHPPVAYPRGQAMWLSGRDCVQLFDRCLQAEYDYGIVYGISANDRRYYSLAPGRALLGYEPEDNAAEWDGTTRR